MRSEIYSTTEIVKGKTSTFVLWSDGAVTGNGKEIAWYKDEKTGKPWIPKKRKSFVSLIRQSIGEGDFD